MSSFYMPPEWIRHDCCWMLWPVRHDNWPEKAQKAQVAFANVICNIAKYEKVKLGVNCEGKESALKLLFGKENVEIIDIEYDDCWMRDVGPTFVYFRPNSNDFSLSLCGIDWKFNAWGEIYADYTQDDKVCSVVVNSLHNCVHLRLESFVLEGGSIHVDGDGTLLTTEECLLHTNRNPSLSKLDIEVYLKTYLGVRKVIWLPRGLICDDDTNGHIDNFCCFSKPGEVLLAWCDDTSDPQYAISSEAFDILSNETDAKGRLLQVVKVPIPPPMFYTPEECTEETKGMLRVPGTRMAASYINFYVANGAIIMPGYHPSTDAIVENVYRQVFPNCDVVIIENARDILVGGGNIHCITQQQPQLPVMET